MKSVFKAAFYLRSNHVNKDGKSMVMLRCSLNGERANFGSTGIGVDPKTWDCTKSRVKGKNTEALSTNLQLSNLEDLVTSLYYNKTVLFWSLTLFFRPYCLLVIRF